MSIFHELGIANVLYWSCYALGFITIFIFNGFYGKKYGIKPTRAVLFTIVSYIVIYLWAYVLAWVANGFQWGHHNAIRVYIWMPLVLLLIGKLFRIDWRTACDFITPSTCLIYGIARLGCVFTGCCYGIPAPWGMYSYQAGHNCFPVQLCEALTSIAIALIVMRAAKKKGYAPEGMLYPFMMILFGGTRFIWEFFADSPRLFFGVTELGIWAFITFLLGVVWYVSADAVRKQKESRAKRHPHKKRR